MAILADGARMSQPLPQLEAFIDRLLAISDRYGRNHDIDRGGDWHLLKLQEEMGELTQSYLALTHRSRRPAEGAKQEMAMEMADVLCMLLLMARKEGIDLNAAVTEKWLRWEDVIRKDAM